MTTEIQQLKMAWLAAKEAGDTQTQMRLLRDHREQQTELIDFIAAYAATAGSDKAEPLLPLTQRAVQTALDRVFTPEKVAAEVMALNLGELRKSRQLSKLAVAKGLRLSLDVWEKFEARAIDMKMPSAAIQAHTMKVIWKLETKVCRSMLIGVPL